MSVEQCLPELVLKSSGGEVYRLVLPPPTLAGSDLEVLPQLLGFRDFLTSWVVVAERWVLVIDVGPSRTIPSLVQSLSEMGVKAQYEAGKDLFILLTHVHIDHSGGLGDLIRDFPRARVVVHPRGRPHLVDPASLWKGSIETLGDLAYAYGQIKPVPHGMILEANAGPGSDTFLKTDILSREVEIFPTPGHASHHQSYLVHLGADTVLFSGEAAGIYLGETNCASHIRRCEKAPENIYLRPATPPRFFYDVYVDSLRNLEQYEPSLICYGHFGYTDDKGLLLREENQLGLWKDIIWEEAMGASRSGAYSPASSGGLEDDDGLLIDRILERLLSEDPLLSGFCSLPQDISLREEYFLKNSIKGFAGYIKSASNEKDL